MLAVCAEWLDGNPLTFNLLRRFIFVNSVPYESYAWNSDGRSLGPYVLPEVESHNPSPVNPNPEDHNATHRRRASRRAGFFQVCWPISICILLTGGSKTSCLREIELRYVRYADDFVVLTCSEDKVVQAYQQIFERLEKSVALGGLGLRMHPLDLDYPGNPNCKTRYVNLSSSPLTFVGFEIAGTGRGAHFASSPKTSKSLRSAGRS